MKEYLEPELLIDLFLSADIMTESSELDNDLENPWLLELPQI